MRTKGNTMAQTTTTTTEADEARAKLAAAGVENVSTLTNEQATEAAKWLGRSYAHAAEKLRSAVKGTVPARFVRLHSVLTCMALESAEVGQPVTYTLAQFCEAAGKVRDIEPTTLRLQYGKMRSYTGDIDGCTVDIDRTTGAVTVTATGA